MPRLRRGAVSRDGVGRLFPRPRRAFIILVASGSPCASRGKPATEGIRDLGHGHTAGDLVVHLPAEDILLAGDLVTWPVPLVGSDQSRIADRVATLEKLRELHPAVIVPGHGPLLRDGAYVALMARLFASVLRQTRAAVARGESLQQALRSVDLEKFRRAFARDDQVRNVLFSQYVAEPATVAAYRQASAGR